MQIILLATLLTITLSIIYIGYVMIWFIGYRWKLLHTLPSWLPMPVIERIYNPIDLQAWFKLPPYPEDRMGDYMEHAIKRSASDLGLEALKHGCIEIEYPDEYKYDCIRRNRPLPLSMYDNDFPIVRMKMRVYKED